MEAKVFKNLLAPHEWQGYSFNVTEFYDIKKNRLSDEEYRSGFCDKKPPLNLITATVESSRCYFCYDAPCIQACPTEINIPSFIRKISTDNIKGAATDILTQNIMGGTCARVCPVESLCEQACVRNTSEDKPVTIGQLQRYATDWLFSHGDQIFKRSFPTGKKIAVVGAGPAGLSCAHRLATLGHNVILYEAKEKACGLNEFGIAKYKVVDEFVQKELDYILALGGIEIKFGKLVGSDITLAKLKQDHHAVFIGTGLSGVNRLEIEGENLPGVSDAVDYISLLRQTSNLGDLPVGRRIVVIGGGNTAIDISVQTKLLGAEDVTMVYRRGPQEMKATWHEQLLARDNGVLIKHWAMPVKINGTREGVTGVEFEKTALDPQGKLKPTGRRFTIPCDMVFKAIGQVLVPGPFGEATPESLKITKGRIFVDKNGQTSIKGIYAGGDCVNGGRLTVSAVQDGKLAALAIHKMLTRT